MNHLLSLARAAFDDVVGVQLDARLEVTNAASANPEFNVVITKPDGPIHEQLGAVLRIADAHQGRLWLDRSGELTIVWPLERDLPGPIGQDGPETVRRREAHGKPVAA